MALQSRTTPRSRTASSGSMSTTQLRNGALFVFAKIWDEPTHMNWVFSASSRSQFYDIHASTSLMQHRSTAAEVEALAAVQLVRRQRMNGGLHHAGQQSAQYLHCRVWSGEVHSAEVEWILKLHFGRIQLGSGQWGKIETIQALVHQYQKTLQDGCHDPQYRMQHSGLGDPKG